MKDVEYYRARGRAEREAAASATCPQARQAHEELAQAYEQLLAASRGKLSIRF
jgi:hypothetical protein